MVVLEAAVITAAGYGAYKGGDAAIRKGKQVQKEMQRESKRRNQRSELATKQKERSERLAKITNMRNNSNTTTTTTNYHQSSSMITTSSNSSSRRGGGDNTNSENDVNERLNSVLQKLNQKPTTASGSNKKKKGIMNLFSSSKK